MRKLILTWIVLSLTLNFGTLAAEKIKATVKIYAGPQNTISNPGAMACDKDAKCLKKPKKAKKKKT